MTVKRNPNYWRAGLPYLDGITYRPIAQDQSRENSLKSGTIDLMVTRDPNAIRDLQHDSGYQVVRNPSVGQNDMDFIILNTSVDPTNDLVVRQALAHAIDVDQLVKLFGAGIAKPNLSLFAPGSPYRAADNGYPKYDLAKAKALVAQAAPNHGGSIKVSLATITDPRLLNEIQAIANMWELAGITTTVSEVEQVTLIDNLVTGQFQAYTDEMFACHRPRPQLRVDEPHHGQPPHRAQLLPQQGRCAGGGPATGPHHVGPHGSRPGLPGGGQAPLGRPAVPVGVAGDVVSDGEQRRGKLQQPHPP